MTSQNHDLGDGPQLGEKAQALLEEFGLESATLSPALWQALEGLDKPWRSIPIARKIQNSAGLLLMGVLASLLRQQWIAAVGFGVVILVLLEIAQHLQLSFARNELEKLVASSSQASEE